MVSNKCNEMIFQTLLTCEEGLKFLPPDDDDQNNYRCFTQWIKYDGGWYQGQLDKESDLKDGRGISIS